MKHSCLKIRFLVVSLFMIFLNCCTSSEAGKEEVRKSKPGNFYVGWASSDITPDRPVIIHGQFHARISEGVMDPLTATALAIESGNGESSEKAILISCDLVFISNDLRDAVRNLIKKSLPELDPNKVIINGTHTHSAPQFASSREVINELDPDFSATSDIKSTYGIELNAMEFSECRDFLAAQIAKAAKQAWMNRKAGGISYGLGHAVVGHNRLETNLSGKSVMYGKTNMPEFSHIEGYEDHSVNLLYTWDENKKLTGVLINIACPSQVSESSFLLSADYWNETRLEVRHRLGNDVYILPQCSAAGDQSPHIMIGEKAEIRMQKLMSGDSIETGDRTVAHRKQIAIRIADAVTSVLPYMKNNIDWNPVFKQRMEVVEISRRILSSEDVNKEIEEADRWKNQYEKMLLEINLNPEIKNKPRWYVNVTSAHRRMLRGYGVKSRYELLKVQPKLPVEVHVLRIADVAFATNEFELYLDYGIRIKGRSPAVQTFLVQLCGHGSYIPTTRAVSGGSYGAAPTSTLIGPEGGQDLVEKTLEMINSLWQGDGN
jgi:hypothetical protein